MQIITEGISWRCHPVPALRLAAWCTSSTATQYQRWWLMLRRDWRTRSGRSSVTCTIRRSWLPSHLATMPLTAVTKRGNSCRRCRCHCATAGRAAPSSAACPLRTSVPTRPCVGRHRNCVRAWAHLGLKIEQPLDRAAAHELQLISSSCAAPRRARGTCSVGYRFEIHDRILSIVFIRCSLAKQGLQFF